MARAAASAKKTTTSYNWPNFLGLPWPNEDDSTKAKTAIQATAMEMKDMEKMVYREAKDKYADKIVEHNKHWLPTHRQTYSKQNQPSDAVEQLAETSQSQEQRQPGKLTSPKGTKTPKILEANPSDKGLKAEKRVRRSTKTHGQLSQNMACTNCQRAHIKCSALAGVPGKCGDNIRPMPFSCCVFAPHNENTVIKMPTGTFH